MIFQPVTSTTILDEFMGRPYLIVFFPKAQTTRCLGFRHDIDDLCWHLVSEELENYTAMRQGWVPYLQTTRKVKVSHGVAFFKCGVLKMEMEGFDFAKFKETLVKFDPHNPNDPPAPVVKKKECCECVVL
ncbi:hypothetical protein IW145_003038 [Coemansia sp. RSA 521]|nr:hypothetical protein GGH15_004766 [Coemansia sp. RSA 562]KAJ2205053.1 hypothetical protein IW145_003038 [Coemansia sp. RSA 521]KAJ2272682.1 hypothetical protein J3F81_002960 [Coemansia sp. RSA 371]KAJ2292245.1 hypothetical protein IW141_002061 [Coemansia sp. RSA 355]